MIEWIVVSIIKLLLILRYAVRLMGLEKIRAKGNKGILFLPNHQALIDSITVIAFLYNYFKLRPMADHDQVNRPFIKKIAKMVDSFIIPDLAKVGQKGIKQVRKALSAIIEGLRKGDNILLYPSGKLSHSYHEDIGGASGVEYIVKAIPGVRIVLVRIKGFWGSSFSWSSGKAPTILHHLKTYIISLLVNLFVFIPRRNITIELYEPPDFPRHADRLTINRYLEHYYNEKVQHNTFVPYFWWKFNGKRILPEPEEKFVSRDATYVSGKIRELIINKINELTGIKNITPQQNLARDLGMDSISLAELLFWAEEKFEIHKIDMNAIKTVSDCFLAASGEIKGKKN
jgi:1-acyl-sn-glycerol-3-phosphate acyltransferase/acyl carrier protein